jgi:pimeloyl-ACP methyl ester carboxylesterase
LTTFVLVHGAWHGAWCWHRVVPLLERAGHRVLTPELPGHGRDRTPVREVSLAGYADAVGRALAGEPEPVVLVGHSLAGMVITQAAANSPGRVRALVYLAAFLPDDGQSLTGLAEGDTESLLTPASRVDVAAGTVSIDPAGLVPALYADCPEEDVALARSVVRPEPLAPLSEPVRLGAARPAATPRIYIECLHDRALPLPRQRLMQAARPCARVHGLPSGHSPFFSVPETLVACLTPT